MSAQRWVLVVAAGSGLRMQSARPKQYLELHGKPVICHTLDVWFSYPGVAGVVLGVQADDPHWAALRPRYPRLLAESAGGASRAQTVLHGLDTLSAHAAADDWVLIHDAVRPCLSHRDIDALIARAGAHADGGLLGYGLSDSVKRCDDAGVVLENVERRGLWCALTPQMFRLGALREALHAAARDGFEPPDDAAAIEHAGGRPLLVEGSPANIKITTARDLDLAALLLSRGDDAGASPPTPRIGYGYDLHGLAADAARPLRLGGVEIPSPLALQGHSDADVLLHAIIDACLGAAGLADIGVHFPDNDPAWRDADSGELLCKVCALVAQAGYGVINVDATVIAEAPRLAPHSALMCARIAACLGIERTRINIKATTNEGMGAVGRGDAIAAHAVVLLQPLGADVATATATVPAQ